MLVQLTETIELHDDGLSDVVLEEGTVIYMDPETNIAYYENNYVQLEDYQFLQVGGGEFEEDESA